MALPETKFIMQSNPPQPGAFFRQLIAGSRFGLSLPDCPDETVAWFLACAIRHLLDGPNERALDNLARMTAEARRRNLGARRWLDLTIAALLKRAELK
jgi:hypothetical protein